MAAVVTPFEVGTRPPGRGRAGGRDDGVDRDRSEIGYCISEV
jgi:hypothetical protein